MGNNADQHDQSGWPEKVPDWRMPRPRTAPSDETGSSYRDRALLPLSRERAAWLVSTVQRRLAERGLETVYEGAGGLRTDSGLVVGLRDLAAQVANTPHRRWLSVVEEAVEMLAAAVETSAERGRSPGELRTRVLPTLLSPVDSDPAFPRPAPAGGVCAIDNQLDATTSVYEVLPGVLAVPSLDYETHLERLSPFDIDMLGGWAVVHDRAVQNLRARPVPKTKTVVARSGDLRGEVKVANSRDYFVASWALAVPDLLTSQELVRMAESGILVAVPNRHLLLLHIPDSIGVLPALRLMAQCAQQQSQGHPGAVSEEVFYFPPAGKAEVATARTQNGVRVTGSALLAHLRAIGAGMGDSGAGGGEIR